MRLVVRDRPKRFPEDEDAVTVESRPEVTWAVRCIPGLRAGKIHNADVVNHNLHSQGPLDVSLGERRYQLRLQAKAPSLADAKVILTHGGRTQVLYLADGFADDPHFDIEWAGDLDADGKLDLIVNLSRKYSVHPAPTAAVVEGIGDPTGRSGRCFHNRRLTAGASGLLSRR